MTTVLPVQCRQCDVPLDLQMVDWDLPGKVVYVAKRVVTRVPEPK
jgi:hypothetical protein